MSRFNNPCFSCSDADGYFRQGYNMELSINGNVLCGSCVADIIKEANPVRRDADIRNTMGFGQTHLLKN